MTGGPTSLGFSIEECVAAWRKFMGGSGEVTEMEKKKKRIDMGVSKNRGTPKWMVYNGKHPVKMDDLGVPLFSETSISIRTELLFFFEKPQDNRI